MSERKKPSKEKLADLGALASGLVHEIRNPLNAIKANLQLMQEDVARDEHGADGPHSRRVKRVLREVDRLDKILSDFLAFVRGGEPERTRCDLSALVTETVALITPQADQLGVAVFADIADGVHAELDAQALRQAIMNLAVNGLQAIKEAARENGTLMIRLKRDSLAGRPAASIEVIDTGGGIPRENLDHIYDLFFTTRSGGTGIGLAVVSKIVASHGGEIRCESEPGKGTAFRILLPSIEEE